ncbi:MAG TPA: HAD-IA family hydrolase [Bryobacteraceae bacterium]|nr:HAD-IA family hydrolase [Bryobacteraceae bacterium]
MANHFRVLYSDIGGVLGTNGWDSELRRGACQRFDVDFEEIDKRHHLMFDSYERGFLRLEAYLQYVFFGVERAFTLDDLRSYIYSRSMPWPENIQLFAGVKKANQLKFGLISNEGQGITEYRVGKFGLREVADFMVISHCVHMRKPDHQIWQLALDLAQVTPSECIYVDDREMFAQVASELGFTAFQHVSLESTRQKFVDLGLRIE